MIITAVYNNQWYFLSCLQFFHSRSRIRFHFAAFMTVSGSKTENANKKTAQVVAYKPGPIVFCISTEVSVPVAPIMLRNMSKQAVKCI